MKPKDPTAPKHAHYHEHDPLPPGLLPEDTAVASANECTGLMFTPAGKRRPAGGLPGALPHGHPPPGARGPGPLQGLPRHGQAPGKAPISHEKGCRETSGGPFLFQTGQTGKIVLYYSGKRKQFWGKSPGERMSFYGKHTNSMAGAFLLPGGVPRVRRGAGPLRAGQRPRPAGHPADSGPGAVQPPAPRPQLPGGGGPAPGRPGEPLHHHGAALLPRRLRRGEAGPQHHPPAGGPGPAGGPPGGHRRHARPRCGGAAPEPGRRPGAGGRLLHRGGPRRPRRLWTPSRPGWSSPCTTARDAFGFDVLARWRTS